MHRAIIWTVFVLTLANVVQIYTKSSKSLEHQRNQKQRAAKHDPGRIFMQHDFATRNGSSDPEVNRKAAKLARYIVHNSNWVSMGTISSTSDLTGYPFVNVKSMADGPKGESSGTPYFYMTPWDQSAIDLTKDNRASLAISMDQDGYCTKNNLDQENPKCGRMILLGHVYKMEPGSENYDFAIKSLFTRHPEMKRWPEDHHFFVANFTPNDVAVVDGHGGPKCVPLDMYYETQPEGPEH